MKPTDRHDANSLVSSSSLLQQSRAKLSAEDRDYIEETIEIILSEFEELQVRLQFLPSNCDLGLPFDWIH